MTRVETGRYPIWLKSMWHWDLQAAIVVGAGVIAACTVFDFKLELDLRWVVPLVGTPFGVLMAAWQQWNSLRTKLKDSDYGELLRMTDESETEVRMPYRITVSAATALVLCSIPAAVAIEYVDSRWVQIAMLSVTSMLTTWSLFALVSSISLSFKQDKIMAQIEAMREKTAAAQRDYARRMRARGAHQSESSE